MNNTQAMKSSSKEYYKKNAKKKVRKYRRN